MGRIGSTVTRWMAELGAALGGIDREYLLTQEQSERALQQSQAAERGDDEDRRRTPDKPWREKSKD